MKSPKYGDQGDHLEPSVNFTSVSLKVPGRCLSLWQTAGCFEIGLSAFLTRLSKIGPLLGPIKLFEYSFGILSSYSCFGPQRNSFKSYSLIKKKKELGNLIHILNTLLSPSWGLSWNPWWAALTGKYPSILLGTPLYLPFILQVTASQSFKGS